MRKSVIMGVMFDFKKLFNSTILGLTLGVLLAGYAVFAFDPPTATPPGGNAEAPVNTGSATQIKTGEFKVGSFVVLGGTLLNGITQINGNVGIGMPASGNKLDVTGDVRWSGTLQAPSLVPWARITGAPIGTVTSGKWCKGNGGVVQCDQEAPPPSCTANGGICTGPGNCCSGNCYLDADGDGYAATLGTMTCRAARSLGADCDDNPAACGADCFLGNSAFTFSPDGKNQDCALGTDNAVGGASKICNTTPQTILLSGIQNACNSWCGGSGTVTCATASCNFSSVSWDWNSCTFSNLTNNLNSVCCALGSVKSCFCATKYY